jgi:hypothetical protein
MLCSLPELSLTDNTTHREQNDNTTSRTRD